MASTTRIAVLKSAIVDGLRLRAGLSGVQIMSADIAQRDAKESILLIGEDMIEQEWAAIGRLSRDEMITLTGMIMVKTPGSSETVIRACRDRCIELMAEVEEFFWDTANAPAVGGIVKSAMARPAELHEIAAGDGSRLAILRFEVRTGRTRLTTS